MKRVIRIAGSFLIVIGIAACGGGGGGGGGPTPPPGPPATGTINSGSVLLVSGRAADAALRSGGFGDITNFVGLTSIAAGSSGPRAGESAKPAGWYVQSQVPVGPDTTPCAFGGTVTVSGDIANPLTVTVGDFLDYEWQSCDDGLGQIIDGFIGMTFTEFEGNLLAGQILLGVSLVVQNFQIIEGGEANTTSGDLSLTIDSRTQPTTVVTTQGSSISVADGSGTDTLTDFLSTVSEDTAMFPPNFTTNLTGTIASTLFEGFVTYDTPIDFESTGIGFPYAGEMLIFGTNNATIRIIAISENDVRIEADYDGDGAMDATIDTSWEDLLAS